MTSDSMETNHAREGFAKKIAHKLQRKHDEDEPDTGKPLHDKPDQHPRHHKVEGCDIARSQSDFLKISTILETCFLSGCET